MTNPYQTLLQKAKENQTSIFLKGNYPEPIQQIIERFENQLSEVNQRLNRAIIISTLSHRYDVMFAIPNNLLKLFSLKYILTESAIVVRKHLAKEFIIESIYTRESMQPDGDKFVSLQFTIELQQGLKSYVNL